MKFFYLITQQSIKTKEMWYHSPNIVIYQGKTNQELTNGQQYQANGFITLPGKKIKTYQGKDLIIAPSILLAVLLPNGKRSTSYSLSYFRAANN